MLVLASLELFGFILGFLALVVSLVAIPVACTRDVSSCES